MEEDMTSQDGDGQLRGDDSGLCDHLSALPSQTSEPRQHITQSTPPCFLKKRNGALPSHTCSLMDRSEASSTT